MELKDSKECKGGVTDHTWDWERRELRRKGRFLKFTPKVLGGVSRSVRKGWGMMMSFG